MKFSAHLDMFWKHFKENKKAILRCLYYWTYSSTHYIILKNNDSLPNCQVFLHGAQKNFSAWFLLVYVLRKIPTLFLRKLLFLPTLFHLYRNGSEYQYVIKWHHSWEPIQSIVLDKAFFVSIDQLSISYCSHGSF